jgi:hypothetical protein
MSKHKCFVAERVHVSSAGIYDLLACPEVELRARETYYSCSIFGSIGTIKVNKEFVFNLLFIMVLFIFVLG